MKPSPRSPRAPSTSRPKPLDRPTMPHFGGASPCQTPRPGPLPPPVGSLTYQMNFAPEAGTRFLMR
jgi:hypothetical protein